MRQSIDLHEHPRGRAKGQRSLRRFLKCLAVPLIVTQVGCAVKEVHVAPAPPVPEINEQDRQTCTVFAQHRADEVGAVESASLEGFHQGLTAGFLYAFYSASHAERANELARKHAYDAAEEKCLTPVILAATLGTDHPDVAAALRDLAIDYAYHEDYRGAESLYPRVLAIQERALGPESDDVATTLEWYGRLLRALHRDDDAAYIEARARRIRANAEHAREPSAGINVPAAADQSPAASTPISPPAPKAE